MKIADSDNYSTKDKRVIWHLSNGKKRYSNKRGRPEIWSQEEIDTLIKDDFKPRAMAYTVDYSFYIHVERMLDAGMITEKDLDKLIYIEGYTVESIDEPVKLEFLAD